MYDLRSLTKLAFTRALGKHLWTTKKLLGPQASACQFWKSRQIFLMGFLIPLKVAYPVHWSTSAVTFESPVVFQKVFALVCICVLWTMCLVCFPIKSIDFYMAPAFTCLEMETVKEMDQCKHALKWHLLLLIETGLNNLYQPVLA